MNHADFNIFAKINCPWLIIEAMKDEVVPVEAIHKWLKTLPLKTRIKLVEVPEASHFFHGKLLELRDIIVNEFQH